MQVCKILYTQAKKYDKIAAVGKALWKSLSDNARELGVSQTKC
jgi:hypothetical protein